MNHGILSAFRVSVKENTQSAGIRTSCLLVQMSYPLDHRACPMTIGQLECKRKIKSMVYHSTMNTSIDLYNAQGRKLRSKIKQTYQQYCSQKLIIQVENYSHHFG